MTIWISRELPLFNFDHLTVSMPISQLVCLYFCLPFFPVLLCLNCFLFFFSCFRNLSYNNLSGVIPSMKNFSWFSADRYCKISSCFHWFFFIFYLSMTLTRGTFYSFLGNSLLCGDWLGSKCRPYIPKSRGVVLYLI